MSPRKRGLLWAAIAGCALVLFGPRVAQEIRAVQEVVDPKSHIILEE